MTTPTSLKAATKWQGIRLGILSLFDLKGAWTMRQSRKLMPPPRTRTSVTETLLNGAQLVNNPQFVGHTEEDSTSWKQTHAHYGPAPE